MPLPGLAGSSENAGTDLAKLSAVSELVYDDVVIRVDAIVHNIDWLMTEGRARATATSSRAEPEQPRSSALGAESEKRLPLNRVCAKPGWIASRVGDAVDDRLCASVGRVSAASGYAVMAWPNHAGPVRCAPWRRPRLDCRLDRGIAPHGCYSERHGVAAQPERLP